MGDAVVEKRCLLHVDMDAFFASVEQSRHPEWRGLPVIVGAGPHERGVVSTCSYEARRFGVHSAMPSRTAYERCPHGIFVRPDMEAYKEVSDLAFEVFSHYSPYVEAVSIDEAFLDITGSVHLFGSPRRLGESLRDEVYRTCSVTCSVGIAPNRLLAKIGSELHKPDGLSCMPFDPDEIVAFLADRPLGVIWGVGAKTAEVLNRYGIRTCGDVQRQSPQRIAAIVGEAAAAQLVESAFGKGDDAVYWQSDEEKSVSREFTFDEDVTDRECVREKLLELVVEVGRRFRARRRWARTARIKLRDGEFRTITRQTAFEKPARDDISFRKKALELFERERTGSVRLIGFGVANLQDDDGTEGLLIADEDDLRRRKLERLSGTLDRLHERGLM